MSNRLMTTNISLKRRHFISYYSTTIDILKYCTYLMFLTVFVVLIQSLTTQFQFFNDRKKSDTGITQSVLNCIDKNFNYVKSDFKLNKDTLSTVFEGQLILVKSIKTEDEPLTPKPDFITTFDMFKLLNENTQRSNSIVS